MMTCSLLFASKVHKMLGDSVALLIHHEMEPLFYVSDDVLTTDAMDESKRSVMQTS